jgi:hypothetical protein
MRKDVKMKTQQEYIEQGEQYILKTYNRFPVVLEKGEGVYLYDADQKKYLDFGAGIAVFALGYGNEAYNQALKDQIDKLIHTSNLYYNIPAVEAAKADLIAGKAHVYDITTFTVDGKTLDSYEADIDTDPDYTPDHEVVSDGYFHESDVAFRSAPYFNVRIDGINLLDEQY